MLRCIHTIKDTWTYIKGPPFRGRVLRVYRTTNERTLRVTDFIRGLRRRLYELFYPGLLDLSSTETSLGVGCFLLSTT